MSAVCHPSCLFWYLYLGHLLADYPLQTGGLLLIKDRWWGRALHVGVHLSVLLLIVGPSRRLLWPYLLTLSALHFVLDTAKRWVGGRKPRWVAGPYLIDQLLHLLMILLVVAWIQVTEPAGLLPPNRNWPIFASGILLATYVWYVTERVLAHDHQDYLHEIIAQRWPRMAIRAGLLTLVLLSQQLVAPQILADSTAVPLLGLLLSVPYQSGAHRRRALITDVSVALLVAVLVAWATWP